MDVVWVTKVKYPVYILPTNGLNGSRNELWRRVAAFAVKCTPNVVLNLYRNGIEIFLSSFQEFNAEVLSSVCAAYVSSFTTNRTTCDAITNQTRVVNPTVETRIIVF